MNEDTLHLLSECAAGTDMAIRSLEDVLKNSAEGRCKSVCLTANASTSSLPRRQRIGCAIRARSRSVQTRRRALCRI